MDACPVPVTVRDCTGHPEMLGDLPPGTVRRVGRLPKLADTNAGVVVLTSPAGYGKTTLLAEWAELDERPFVRVPMGEQENGAQLLVASVVRALATVQSIGHRPFAVARDDSAGASLEILASLLGQRWEPFVLALDDVHYLWSEASNTVLHALVEHLPRGAQLVLAGRRSSQFRLARLRAGHGLFELDATDLAFCYEESETLLTRSGIDLGPDAITALTEQTEGWPAALYLATLALR
jgi:LuxR family transcriptional regulator, maltose regulon positive regulatory protein